jgi:ComF family protein
MDIFDFLFPKKCLGCGRTGGYFCADCLNFASLDRLQICPVCERPAIGGMTHPACKTRESLDGFTSIFTYKGVIRKGITKLKYNFVSDLASELVELFLSSCGEDESFTRFCRQRDVFLVSVPLHPARERWRGFSQTRLLGSLIAKNLDLQFLPDLLIRVKNTRPQVELDEKERKENIKDAFVINAKTSRFAIHTSNLLLLDDVWTSGATLKEAGKTLKKGGAKTVWGLTLAR